MFVRHQVRVVLRLGDTHLIPMDEEDAAKTRANLLKMSRRQRRAVEKLSAANQALREQVGAVEREILAFAETPEYVAADRVLDFRAGMRRAARLASLETNLALLGSTLNPFVMEGDRSIKYLSEERDTRRWLRSLEQDYAKEASQVQAHIGKLQAELAEMRSFAAKHTAKLAERRGMVEGVSNPQ